ncbi:acyl-CoA/acyl-ACP dehydrogenase [Arthrobacter sp. ATA002]|uniref:acyl-CoA dehydrogenase family protein n=1 Tax=Arthrobacter sp. ATA002 TaxID=2991715 RepID=UPI0022A6795B|nr:acyl-CoA dehydrogenase family protein [Arthrobacter sp. ATA002]WAP50508.1 acyl-CoA/acyl-ACP dehydrogenase [Arthrobacter sp. ATA002]
MQFELDEDLREAAQLAEEIFTQLADLQRVRDVERELGGHDGKLWAALAESGILGLALPEEHGGSGLGMLALAAVLEQQGRRVAPVPLAAAVAMAAMPLAAWGTPSQCERWLPAFLDGSALIVGAIDASVDGDNAIRGERDGSGWKLSGTLSAVPGATAADALLVPVTTDTGVAAVLLPTDREGVHRESIAVTHQGAAATVVLSGVHVDGDELLTGGSAAIRQARLLGRIALAAVQAGVCDEAIAITAAYTSERIQFDRPLSTNQAVSARAADAHLDAERIKLTTRRAAWLVDQESDDAESASLVASWWAAQGGLRVVHTTQHLHGGMGADIDYSIHRYFLWGRQNAYSLGSAPALLAELGSMVETLPMIGAPV